MVMTSKKSTSNVIDKVDEVDAIKQKNRGTTAGTPHKLLEEEAEEDSPKTAATALLSSIKISDGGKVKKGTILKKK